MVVDAAGYRERRRETLEALAMRSAESVRATGEPVELEPMSSIERRIVHLRLQDEPGRDDAERGRGALSLLVVAAADVTSLAPRGCSRRPG